MTPTSPASLKAKAGFTLLEMLIVLALMGLAAAMMIPSIARTLASNANHRETFTFQHLLMGLRAKAFHEEMAIQVVQTGDFKTDDQDPDPLPAEIRLDEGWSYRLSAPINITPRGFCDQTTADLAYHDERRVRLTVASDCTLTAQRIG